MIGVEAIRKVMALHGRTPFGVTGPDRGQCTAVPHSLQAEVLRIPIVYGHAKDIYANAPSSQYVKLRGNPTILPGDIVVQGGDPVLGTDPRFGHVFVATQRSNPGQAIVGYSQNYPTGREPHVRSFPRNGLIGIIRARVLQSGGGNALVSTEEYNAMKAEAIAGWADYYVGRRPGITEIRRWHLKNSLAKDRAGWRNSDERRKKIKRGVTNILRVVAGPSYVYPDSEVEKHMRAGTPWRSILVDAQQNAINHLVKKAPSDAEQKVEQLRQALVDIETKARQAKSI